MPRSSRSSGGGGRSSGGSRPMSTSSRSSAPVQQPHHPAPAAHAPPPAGAYPPQMQQQRQPGLFANMASTAAGVAVGSSVGHAVSGMLFGGGGGSREEPQQQQQAYGQQPQAYDQGYNAAGAYGQAQQQNMQGSCDAQSKELMRCLDASGNDMSACQYYLDALKACTAASRAYA